ncbi:hypothetical protein [Nitrosomonas sp. ANs5]|uniref:hypothetical protein n=1 Tax=Nitrosomonas sp. ANs5 TaxID=3423941 RepID=UPI003D33EC49
MQQNRTFTCLALSALLTAAGCTQPAKLSEAEKQQNLAKQQCLDDIDQTEIERLSVRSAAFDAEIEALCKAGERELAQSRALLYSQQLLADPILRALRQCGKDINALLPIVITEPDETGQAVSQMPHVCDQQPRPKRRWRQFTVWP